MHVFNVCMRTHRHSLSTKLHFQTVKWLSLHTASFAEAEVLLLLAVHNIISYWHLFFMKHNITKH